VTYGTVLELLLNFMSAFIVEEYLSNFNSMSINANTNKYTNVISIEMWIFVYSVIYITGT